MIEVLIKVRKLRAGAVLPARAHQPDACWDVAAIEHAVIMPGDRYLVPLGFATELPPGWEIQVRPRSGLARQHGIVVLNAPGTIDAGYQGEHVALLINHGRAPFEVLPGMRVAQFAVRRVPDVRFAWTDEVPEETERSTGGFGSSGA